MPARHETSCWGMHRVTAVGGAFRRQSGEGRIYHPTWGRSSRELNHPRIVESQSFDPAEGVGEVVAVYYWYRKKEWLEMIKSRKKFWITSPCVDLSYIVISGPIPVKLNK